MPAAERLSGASLESILNRRRFAPRTPRGFKNLFTRVLTRFQREQEGTGDPTIVARPFTEALSLS